MIRYSQTTVASHFKDGRSVAKTIEGLKTGKIDPSDFTKNPIRIVEKDGKIYTLDNRRLYVFREAGIEVPYTKLEQIPEREMFKFTTEDDGFSVRVVPPRL